MSLQYLFSRGINFVQTPVSFLGKKWGGGCTTIYLSPEGRVTKHFVAALQETIKNDSRGMTFQQSKLPLSIS